jgi:hypothetical protein
MERRVEMSETHCDENYVGLEFGRVELSRVMRETYDEIIKFVATPSFCRFYGELMALSPTERPTYVGRVLFNPEELQLRNIEVPEGIFIQNSAFGDRRPTLFVVKKMMPEKYQVVWENMNITFFNEFSEESVPTSIENAWRPPLPVALQNSMLMSGTSLESLPAEAGVKFGIYKEPGL